MEHECCSCAVRLRESAEALRAAEEALETIAEGVKGAWDETYKVTRFMPYGEINIHARRALARLRAGLGEG